MHSYNTYITHLTHTHTYTYSHTHSYAFTGVILAIVFANAIVSVIQEVYIHIMYGIYVLYMDLL